MPLNFAPAYLDARRERKTVSTLRENALRQFQAEQSRRDQSALDEMFLAKLIHSRNATRQSRRILNRIHDRNLTCKLVSWPPKCIESPRMKASPIFAADAPVPGQHQP